MTRLDERRTYAHARVESDTISSPFSSFKSVGNELDTSTTARGARTLEVGNIRVGIVIEPTARVGVRPYTLQRKELQREEHTRRTNGLTR
jgi:hypothetical protein